MSTLEHKLVSNPITGKTKCSVCHGSWVFPYPEIPPGNCPGPVRRSESNWCVAVQRSDRMECTSCGLTWDMNDPEPPMCGRSHPLGPIVRPHKIVRELGHTMECTICHETANNLLLFSEVCPGPPTKTALDYLGEAVELFKQRNAVYRNNYTEMGPLILALFGPGGVPAITTPEEANRLNLIIDCLGKLQRYAFQFAEGGHRDSALDLVNYAAMLREVTK